MQLDQLKSILVPTDFSEASVEALDTAVALAQTFHAAIEIMHVDLDSALVRPPPCDIPGMPIIAQNATSSAAEKLARTVAEVRAKGVVCTSASQSGHTHSAIVEHALRTGVGLIVIGSHGRHGLRHVLLGSVGEKVVQNAPCPVLVVPVPPSFKPAAR